MSQRKLPTVQVVIVLFLLSFLILRHLKHDNSLYDIKKKKYATPAIKKSDIKRLCNVCWIREMSAFERNEIKKPAKRDMGVQCQRTTSTGIPAYDICSIGAISGDEKYRSMGSPMMSGDLSSPIPVGEPSQQ